LGFKLPEIETCCLKVERNYRDQINKTTLLTKSDFVEKLTHDSYIVQVERITDRYQTRLDKLLSIFEQTNFVDEKKITKEFNHEVDIEEIKIATDILHHSGTNTEERRKIENEQEGWRSVNAMFEDKEKKYQKALEESRKALTEKDLLIAELRENWRKRNNSPLNTNVEFMISRGILVSRCFVLLRSWSRGYFRSPKSPSIVNT